MQNPKLRDKSAPRKIDNSSQVKIPKSKLSHGKVNGCKVVHIPELRIWVETDLTTEQVRNKYLNRTVFKHLGKGGRCYVKEGEL